MCHSFLRFVDRASRYIRVMKTIPTRPTVSQLKSTTRTSVVYMYIVNLQMMGYKYARNT